jgi:hypothetical protein
MAIGSHARLSLSTQSGRSALMLASKSNHLSCVKFLLQHGALLNLRDKDGLTALTLAIRSNSKDCAELLAETIQGHSLSRAFHFGGGGGLPAPSAQAFGLQASPQQMAQEEFDVSTNFLVQVTEQLRLYLLHGKQAVYDAVQVLNDRHAELKPLATSASSPMQLNSPLASIPRSSSYFNSFPSPASGAQVSVTSIRGLESLPAIAASPRNAANHVGVTTATPPPVAFRPPPTSIHLTVPSAAGSHNRRCRRRVARRIHSHSWPCCHKPRRNHGDQATRSRKDTPSANQLQLTPFQLLQLLDIWIA